MKYLESYEVYINPDRISDEKIKIYSNKLEITKGSFDDKKGINLFYISNISIENDHDNNVIGIDFYNNSFTAFGNKLIRVKFRTRIYDDELESMYGEVGSVTDPKICDILFTKESFYQLMEFVKDDTPECYDMLKTISYEDIVSGHKKLVRRS